MRSGKKGGALGLTNEDQREKSKKQEKMGDARRAYEHYRWAERYSRRGRDDKAGAHLKRALHYGLNGLNGLNGLSGFGGVKRPLDTGDAGHLTTQEALVGAYEQTEPESRLGFLRSLCSAEFRCFFYDKPSPDKRDAKGHVQKPR